MITLNSLMLPLLLWAQSAQAVATALDTRLFARQSTVTGDSKCGTALCIAAVVNGSTVQYTLTSKRQAVGWMGMGFGSQMSRTPMVIMWANTDGSITLSQRQAPSEVMPTVVTNPPRVATLQDALSVTSGSSPQYVYTIPADSGTKQSLIYAFGSTRPSSPAVDAVLVQHVDYGILTLDLAKPISSTPTGSGTTATPTGKGDTSSTDGGDDIPLTANQRTIVAHAIFATIGFSLFLPIGALLPRYFRTFTPTWFQGHWILQFGLAGPTILIGVSLGIAAVQNKGGNHLSDAHKRWGITLFILYFIQISLGAIIHWVKAKNRTRRPLQNYLHAILGLLIIGLSLYQVHLGYAEEWPQSTGRGALSNGVNILFYVWVILLPVSYAIGLAFLPKQFRQERKSSARSEDDETNYLNLSQRQNRRDYDRSEGYL